MVTVHTKKNVLFYQNDKDEVKELEIYKTDKKLKVKEAEDLLKKYDKLNGIGFKRLINIFFEDMVLEIPAGDIKYYIREEKENE